jgi:hypothetical protein
MESEAQRPFALGDDATTVARQLMDSAVVKGLKHMMPIGVAGRIRAVLMPLLSEITVLAIRLSMMSDEGPKEQVKTFSTA